VARIKRECAKHGFKIKAAECRDLLGVNDATDLWGKLNTHLQEGMTEDNYGQWHVDHRVPVAMFDLTKPDHRKRCFCHTNMTPMWAHDNMAKGCSM